MEALGAVLVSDYGEGLADEIQRGYAVRRPTSLRINTLKATADKVDFVLRSEGRNCRRISWFQSARVLDGPSDLRESSLYREGKIYLQSLSSMLPPLYLAPGAGEDILDMTAAPGGKTSEMYALSGGKALITACEKDNLRCERLKFNLERQGAGRVNVLKTDALLLDNAFSFDKILLDAPCSGTGTYQTDDPVRFSLPFLKKCVERQEKLLKKALTLLKKGGTLVYSTCSVLKDENERLLARVLPAMGADLVPIEPFDGLPLLPSAPGTLAVRPTELYEGFFVAKIMK